MTAGAVVLGALFSLLALAIGLFVRQALRTGELVGRYGVAVQRASAPRRFWSGIGAFFVLGLICVAFAAAGFLSRAVL